MTLTRCTHAVSRLCEEASAAKKADGDMYQRKTKLIGKLQQMYTVLNSHVTNLGRYLTSHHTEKHSYVPDNRSSPRMCTAN
jgi:hypothetical protein